VVDPVAPPCRWLEPGQQKMLAEPLMAALRGRWSAFGQRSKVGADWHGPGRRRAVSSAFGIERMRRSLAAARLTGIMMWALKNRLGQLVFDLG